MKKSYLKKSFLALWVVLIVTMLIFLISMIYTGRKTIGQELISLHEKNLSNMVREPSSLIHNMESSLERVAQSSGIIEALENEESETSRRTMQSVVSDEMFQNYREGNKIRIFLYDTEKLRYASETPAYEYDEVSLYLQKASREKYSGLTGCMLSKTVHHPSDIGIYLYSFYIIHPVKDYLTGEICGYALMQCSEVALFEMYRDYMDEKTSFCITDSSGKILSDKNKVRIGDTVSVFEKIQTEDSVSTSYIPSEKNQIYFFAPIEGTDWYLVERTDTSILYSSLNKAGVVDGFLLVAAVGIAALSILLVLRKILPPIKVIGERMNVVARGSLNTEIKENEMGKGELQEMALSFNYMVTRLRNQMNQIREMENRKHMLQMDLLRAQINPHFIYNTLSSIRFDVEMGKNEEASRMLLAFSKILRKTISGSEKMITLREEKETILEYLELQKGRYRGRFEVTLVMPEDTLSILVPDFILQPIVENAIYYSLEANQKAHIVINSRINDDTLEVSVSDDGNGMDEDTIKHVFDKSMIINSIGIRNVDERIKMNFGEMYGVRINSEKGEGTTVTLFFPGTETARSELS